MNRQDLKDESKETEGPPEVKAKIRRLQYETVRKAVKQAESLENVNDASAIIVNPTHFAVAIKYEVGSEGAPIILAMGRGMIAEKIIKLAEENTITVFNGVEIGSYYVNIVDDLGCEVESSSVSTIDGPLEIHPNKFS